MVGQPIFEKYVFDLSMSCPSAHPFGSSEYSAGQHYVIMVGILKSSLQKKPSDLLENDSLGKRRDDGMEMGMYMGG